MTRCLSCQADNPATARFCMACGSALARRCAACGADMPPDARFCMSCGAPIADAPPPAVPEAPAPAHAPAQAPPPAPAARTGGAGAAPEAEYRQLTVLFSDLVGSTALSEQLDPEHLRDILRSYQALATRVVERFGGHLAKYLGDGLMAYFGYPIAHEEDAQRAVRAGLALLDGLAPIREAARAAHGVAIHARIGVHTGPVVAGDMGGDGALESDAIVGRTPNIAARLQEAAEPDSLVVSADTQNLVRGFFEVVDLGPHALKGLAEPLTLYQVLHESAARTRLEAIPAAQLTPLVGREHEYGLLAGRWAQALDGERPAVLVEGEAGVGKSRLIRALKDLVAEDPSAWLTECACSPFHTSTASYPAIDLLSRVVLQFDRGEPAASRLAKIDGFVAQYGFPGAETVPLLADLLGVPLGSAYAPLGLSPELQRQRTIKLLVDILLRRASIQPVLYVVEDVHWADPTTFAFLDALLDDPRPAQIMVVMTTRPQGTVPVGDRPDVERLTVNRLGQGQVARLIERVAGGKRLPSEVVDLLVAKTDGVPLYVEELTKMVIEGGLLRLEGDRYLLDGPLPELAIPATLQDSLMARLDRLAREKGVAQLGSAIGREFGHDILAATSDLPAPELDASIAQLVDTELLYRRQSSSAGATYLFKHALIQDAAYATLLTSARRRIHARIGAAYEAHFPEVLTGQPALVAQHFTAAEMPEKAAEYWLRSGGLALARCATAEAIGDLSRGLELVARLPAGEARAAQELAFHHALGQAHLLAEGYSSPGVEAHLAAARSLCHALGHPPQTAPVTWGLWACYLVRGEYAQTRELSDALLADCEAAGDEDGLLEAYMMAGIDRYYTADMEGSDAYFARCAAAYDPERHAGRIIEYGNDSGMAGRSYRALLHWWRGRAERALAVGEEGVAMSRAVGHPYMVGFTLTFMARLHQMRGDLAALYATADEAIEIAVHHGFPIWEGYGRIVRGWAYAHDGRAEQGLAEMEAGLAGWNAMGARIWLPYFLGLKAECCLEVGRLDEGRAAIQAAEDVAAATGERLDAAYFALVRGRLHLAAGEAAAGEAELRRALELAEAMGARAWRLHAAHHLAAHLAADGRGDEAHAVLEPALAAMPEGGDEPDQVAARAALAELPVA